MSSTICRPVYRALLWLHPPFFRKRFADEMLWLFDETVATEGAVALLLDGLISMLRQWLLRPRSSRIVPARSWRVAAAVLGALLQVGIVTALTANHATRTASVRRMNSSAATATASRSAAPVVSSNAAPASATPEPAAILATTPVGDAPLVFMLFFAIVLVYAFQRRRFSIEKHSARRAGMPALAGDRSTAKRRLSIIAD